MCRFIICWLFLGFSNNLFADTSKVLRIGYQSYGTLILVKGRGQLSNKLADLGVKVEWTKFETGINMSEAFSEKRLDFIVVGEVPPVFMQSAGIPLVYVGHEPPSPHSEALIIPKNSTITTLADLKGKKIAFAKGTNVHLLFFKILEKAGLTEEEVHIVYLLPDQGYKALENNTVDAWAIWDPFLAAAQQELGAKILIDGQGLILGYQFYLARRDYAEQNPQVINILLEEIRRIDVGVKKNLSMVAKFLASRIGLSPSVLEIALNRMNTDVQLMSTEAIIAQQQLADLFHQKGLIKKISLQEAIWKLPEK
ncbi:MAG: hypothetical protein BWK79_13400 [Beggiatoa sp. IS2]|nr:MAG: hypothetical protein BWK79_13400 [Beggiatoa sp. IS2]